MKKPPFGGFLTAAHRRKNKKGPLEGGPSFLILILYFADYDK